MLVMLAYARAALVVAGALGLETPPRSYESELQDSDPNQPGHSAGFGCRTGPLAAAAAQVCQGSPAMRNCSSKASACEANCEIELSMVRPCMECLQPPIQGEVKASSNHSADDPQAPMHMQSQLYESP